MAAAHGVTTEYTDHRRRRVAVGAAAVRHALAAMGVAAGSAAEVGESLGLARATAAERLLPPTIVRRVDGSTPLRVAGVARAARLELEDGRSVEAATTDCGVTLPAHVPTGYHRLHVATDAGEATAPLILAPARCPLPLQGPGWGWMVQLYQAISSGSWGIGDYADLRTIVEAGGGQGAAMVLVNPLHAPSPTLPQQDSPYYPSSRRFRSPLYLRPDDLPEMRLLDGDARARVAQLADEARRGLVDRIDRDRVYRAKDAALRLLFAARDEGDAGFATWRAGQGASLEDFATFCALAERRGTPWQSWPAGLRHPATGAVTAARRELAGAVEYHAWLQWRCDSQLAEVAAAGSDMPLGVVHDLAVGVDPGGADAWALQDQLADAVTIGAPPDGFNQQGQDWRLPPLVPRHLTQAAYAPFTEMLRSVLRHAGGVRIDHIMGLWRLWWVPEGGSAADGTYVRYPADDLLGVLALEAERAGALVVGEDLGTVEDGVRSTLAERGVLSSRVVWFERVADDPAAPRCPAVGYPRLALASVTTHDLPTAAGWWTDEDVRVQTALGLFAATTTPDAEATRKAAERAELGDLLRSEGLLTRAEPTIDEFVDALHAFLARTPCLLVAASLADALGDRSQPNLPGTTDAYPNWRLPLARFRDGRHQAVTLEAALADPRVAALAERLRRRR